MILKEYPLSNRIISFPFYMNAFFLVGSVFLLGLSYTFSSFPVKDIKLTPKNSLLIRGQITDKTATDFVYELNKRHTKKGLYVFLDTNGGSVDAGNKIINEIQKYNVSCIANKAISMGFVILQSCHKRYVTPMATLMQHQMSYGVANEKEKVESYVQFIKQIGEHLVEMQANRIGLNPSEFKLRTFNDWWIFGENAIKENCADKMANVKCNPTLTNQTYSVDHGSSKYIFSNCPLVAGPVEIIRDKNKRDSIYFI